MKKILSLVLSVLLVVTSMSVVFTLETTAFADSANLVTDGTFEDYDANYVLAARGLYHYVAATTNKVSFSDINANNWTISAYGEGVVTEAQAHSGTKSLNLPRTGGHCVYKALSVTPNTNYYVTYWYYLTGGTIASPASNMTYGIPGDATQVAIWGTNKPYATSGSDTDGNGPGGANSDTPYGKQAYLTVTNTVGFSSLNTEEWTQVSYQFNSGEFSKVLLPFVCSSANGVYVDDFEAYEIASDSDVATVTNQDGTKLAQGLVTVSSGTVLIPGASVTLTASTDYEEATFKGWYLNDELVTSNAVLNTTYTGAQYEAKYDCINLFIGGRADGLSSGTVLTGGVQYNGSLAKPNNMGWWPYNASASATVSDNYGKSGSNSIAIKNAWNSVFRVIDVDPNTTYKFGFSFLLAADTPEETAAKKKNVFGRIAIAKVSSSYAGGDWYPNTSANNLVQAEENGIIGFNPNDQSHPTWNPYAAAGSNVSQGAWVDVTNVTTFTTDADTVKFIVLFKGEYKQCADVYTYLDNVFLIKNSDYTGGTPTVTAQTSGITTPAGGTASVTRNGYLNYTFTATPTDGGCTFDGWYSGDTLVSSDTTYTNDYFNKRELTAKFTRNFIPLITDGDFESYANNATIGGAYTWVSASTNKVSFAAIDANGWTKSAYGGGTATTAMAHSGSKSMLYSGANGHRLYKALSVTPYTDYIISFWYYQDTACLQPPANITNDPYGIPADATTIAIWNTNQIYVTNGSDTDANGLGGKNSDTPYGKQQPITPTSYSGYGVTGQWAKATINLNTGEYSKILIPFPSSTKNGVYIDDLDAMAIPSVTVVTTGKTAQAGGTASATFNGTNMTFTAAVADASSTFTGWFDGETLLSTDTTYIAYFSGTSITAKFNRSAYCIADGGFEDYAVDTRLDQENSATLFGYVATSTNMVSFAKISQRSWTMTAYGKGLISTDKAHTGSKSLYSYTGSHGMFKVIDVDPHTDYKYTFWYYQTGDYVKATDQNVYGIPNDATRIAIFNNFLPYETEGGNDGGSTASESYGKQQMLTMTKYGFGTTNEWAQASIVFNTGEFSRILLPLRVASNTGAYFDDLAIEEVEMIGVNYETVGAGGNGGTATVTGTSVIAENGNALTYRAYPISDYAEFLGWFEPGSEIPVSTDLVYNKTISALNPYSLLTAKFNTTLTNCYTGVDAENYTLDTTIVPATAVGNVAQFTGADPYWSMTSAANGWGKVFVSNDYVKSGLQSFKVSARNNGITIKLTGLNTDTFYNISYYYYVPEQYYGSGNDEGKTNSMGYTYVTEPGFATTQNQGFIADTTIGATDASGEHALLAYNNLSSSTVYAEWTKTSLGFNTGDNTEVWLTICYFGPTVDGDSPAYYYYLDEFKLLDGENLAKAATTEYKADVTDMGVAIRTVGAQALRFKSRISKATFDAAALYETYTIVEQGVLAIRSEFLGSDELVVGYENLAGKKASKGVTYSIEEHVNKVFAESENGIIFSGALTGISAERYQVDYTVRVYAIIERADGALVTVYDDPREANVFDVAVAAYSAGAEDPEILEYLYNNILSVVDPSTYPPVA